MQCSWDEDRLLIPIRILVQKALHKRTIQWKLIYRTTQIIEDTRTWMRIIKRYSCAPCWCLDEKSRPSIKCFQRYLPTWVSAYTNFRFCETDLWQQMAWKDRTVIRDNCFLYLLIVLIISKTTGTMSYSTKLSSSSDLWKWKGVSKNTQWYFAFCLSTYSRLLSTV